MMFKLQSEHTRKILKQGYSHANLIKCFLKRAVLAKTAVYDWLPDDWNNGWLHNQKRVLRVKCSLGQIATLTLQKVLQQQR